MDPVTPIGGVPVTTGTISMLPPSGNPHLIMSMDGRTAAAMTPRGWTYASPEQVLEQQRLIGAGQGWGPIATGLESLARTATFGGSNYLEKALGFDPANIAARQEANPGMDLLGAAGGIALPLGAEGLLARAGESGLGHLAGAAPGLISEAGGAIARGVGGALPAAWDSSALGRIGKSAFSALASGAGEGALYGAGQYVGDEALPDAPTISEALLANGGMGDLLRDVLAGSTVGGLTGGLLGTTGSALKEGSAALSPWLKGLQEEAIRKNISLPLDTNIPPVSNLKYKTQSPMQEAASGISKVPLVGSVPIVDPHDIDELAKHGVINGFTSPESLSRNSEEFLEKAKNDMMVFLGNKETVTGEKLRDLWPLWATSDDGMRDVNTILDETLHAEDPALMLKYDDIIHRIELGRSGIRLGRLGQRVDSIKANEGLQDIAQHEATVQAMQKHLQGIYEGATRPDLGVDLSGRNAADFTDKANALNNSIKSSGGADIRKAEQDILTRGVDEWLARRKAALPLYSEFQKAIDKAEATPARYSPAMVGKLQDIQQTLAKSVTGDAPSQYQAILTARRALDKMSKWGAKLSPEAKETTDLIRGVRAKAKEVLTNPDVWGTASVQREMGYNSAFSSARTAEENLIGEKGFLQRAESTGTGVEKNFSASKVKTFLGKLGNPINRENEERLESWLDAHEKLNRETAKSSVLALHPYDMGAVDKGIRELRLAREGARTSSLDAADTFEKEFMSKGSISPKAMKEYIANLGTPANAYREQVLDRFLKAAPDINREITQLPVDVKLKSDIAELPKMVRKLKLSAQKMNYLGKIKDILKEARPSKKDSDIDNALIGMWEAVSSGSVLKGAATWAATAVGRPIAKEFGNKAALQSLIWLNKLVDAVRDVDVIHFSDQNMRSLRIEIAKSFGFRNSVETAVGEYAKAGIRAEREQESHPVPGMEPSTVPGTAAAHGSPDPTLNGNGGNLRLPVGPAPVPISTFVGIPTSPIGQEIGFQIRQAMQSAATATVKDLGDIAKEVAEGGLSQKPAKAMDEERILNTIKTVNTLSNNPDMLLDRASELTKDVNHHDPRVSDAATQSMANAVNYLAAHAPQPSESYPMQPSTPPPHDELLAFEHRVEAAVDPVGAISRNAADAATMETVNALYPKLASELRTSLMTQLSGQPSASYTEAQRTQAGNILGVPMDASQEAWNITLNQSAFLGSKSPSNAGLGATRAKPFTGKPAPIGPQFPIQRSW